MKHILNEYSNVCLSGGANGSDLQWGMNAGKNDHCVIHWIFKGYKSNAPNSEKVILNKDQLEKSDYYIEQANNVLKRNIPYNNYYVLNLLRRNYYQVCWSEFVYAVTTFDNNIVQGGTAWAVQMFVNNNKPNNNLFVFDQYNNHWLTWVDFSSNKMPIFEITKDVPKPKKIWAGIGTRNLNEKGKNAIRNLFV